MAKSFDELASRVMSVRALARAAEWARELLGELMPEIRERAGKGSDESARQLGRWILKSAKKRHLPRG